MHDTRSIFVGHLFCYKCTGPKFCYIFVHSYLAQPEWQKCESLKDATWQGKVRCDCLQVKAAYLWQFVVFWLQVAQGVLITVPCVLITHTVSMTTRQQVCSEDIWKCSCKPGFTGDGISCTGKGEPGFVLSYLA